MCATTRQATNTYTQGTQKTTGAQLEQAYISTAAVHRRTVPVWCGQCRHLSYQRPRFDTTAARAQQSRWFYGRRTCSRPRELSYFLPTFESARAATASSSSTVAMATWRPLVPPLSSLPSTRRTARWRTPFRAAATAMHLLRCSAAGERKRTKPTAFGTPTKTATRAVANDNRAQALMVGRVTTQRSSTCLVVSL